MLCLLRRAVHRPFITMLVIMLSVGIASAGYLTWELSRLTRFDERIEPVSKSDEQISVTPEIPEGVSRILVFSTGSDGLNPDLDGERLGIGRGRAAMADQLTDSILLLTLAPENGKIGIVSFPRDTWLEWRGHRVNESYKRHGVSALVDDIETLSGIRAEHAIALNFAAFADLTDSLGGVRLYFEAPARDFKAKLDIPSAGCVTLDGSNALAFVRSRHWQVYTNGTWRSDSSSSDWGRILRQQAFIQGAVSQLLTWQLPSRVPALFTVARENVTLDQGLSITKLAGLAQGFVLNRPEITSITFPGRGGSTESGASVIFPDLERGLSMVAEQEAAVTAKATATPQPDSTAVEVFDVAPKATDPSLNPTSENSETAGPMTRPASRWPSC
jgi:LCP family protein required for cell wall assembly